MHSTLHKVRYRLQMHLYQVFEARGLGQMELLVLQVLLVLPDHRDQREQPDQQELQALKVFVLISPFFIE